MCAESAGIHDPSSQTAGVSSSRERSTGRHSFEPHGHPGARPDDAWTLTDLRISVGGAARAPHRAARELLALLAAQELVARTGVGLGLSDSLSQRLGMDAQVDRDVGDRWAQRHAARLLIVSCGSE